MKLFATLITFFLLVLSAVGAAVPSDPTVPPTVTMIISKNSTCSNDGTFTVGMDCTRLPADTSSLQVFSVSNDGRVQYNSLRVYHNEVCKGFGDIEPAWGCAGPGAQGCGCSVVGAYKSIRLVVE